MSQDESKTNSFASELTTRYTERVEQGVEENFTDEYFDSLGGPREVLKTQLASQAWRELYIGTIPQSRQLAQVYEIGEPYHRDRDIVVGLAKQIRDEVNHAKILANMSENLGVECDLATWKTENYDELIGICDAAARHEKPHQIAAANQCSTEVFAAVLARRLAEYVEDEYPDIATTLMDISADEGDHLHVGRLIIRRFASPEEHDELNEIAEKKWQSLDTALQSL